MLAAQVVCRFIYNITPAAQTVNCKLFPTAIPGEPPQCLWHCSAHKYSSSVPALLCPDPINSPGLCVVTGSGVAKGGRIRPRIKSRLGEMECSRVQGLGEVWCGVVIISVVVVVCYRSTGSAYPGSLRLAPYAVRRLFASPPSRHSY